MPVFRKQGKAILFIHVPKTGGSAIERVFRDDGWSIDFLDGKVGAGTLNNLRRCTPQHMHARPLRQTFVLRRFDEIFLIVRDPVARLRSEYVWRHRKQDRIDPRAAAVDAWTLRTFASYRRNNFLFDNHVRPQSDFVVPGATIHHFENGLNSVISDLNKRLDLDLPTVPPHVRSGSEQGVSSSAVEILEKTERRIRAFYREDYQRFGYDEHGVPGGPIREPFASRLRRSVRARASAWARR